MKKLIVGSVLILIVATLVKYALFTSDKQDYLDEDYYINDQVMSITSSISMFTFNNIDFEKLDSQYQVSWGNHKISIIEPEVELGAYIKEVSISPSCELMAITINDISHTKVLVVNLITNEIIFNGYKTDFEIIDNPLWGPNNELCLIVGSICDLEPALLDLKTNTIKILPTDNTSEIIKIKWSNGGDFVDYCFNDIDDENSFKLYRYDIETGKTMLIDKFTYSEFNKWSVKH